MHMYHPSYYYIEKLGCRDPVRICATFSVYIELCEVKRYWDVKYKFNEELDLLYLEVQKKKNSDIEYFVPWPALYNISLDKIEKMQKGLNSKSITIVFKSDDSTSIMYKVTEGLVKPVHPEVSKRLREKEEKKLCLEKELKRNWTYLYELATSLSNTSENNESTEDAIKGNTNTTL